MILSAREVWAAWTWVARGQGLEASGGNRGAIAGARARAKTLAYGPEVAPAAVFFAFCRRPSCFPRKARRQMLAVLTIAQAKQLGLVVRVSPQRINQVCAHIRGHLPPRWDFARTAQEVHTWLGPQP